MKQTLLLLFFIITMFPVYCQSSLEEGDLCFDKGDYSCAEAKYNEAFQSGSGKEQQLAEIKRSRAKWCAEHLKKANQAFTGEKYEIAKENFQKVLDTNPKDSYAKAQMRNCEDKLFLLSITLSVSQKTISFFSSGGSEKVTVTTNASSFSVENLPAWCTVQLFAGHFVLTCSSNPGNTVRNHMILVTAGERKVTVSLTQAGMEKQSETTLRVTESNLSFPSSGGKSKDITVYSNDGNYLVPFVPSWCSVQTFNGYFVITCTANSTGEARSGWVRVLAGDKEVKIYVAQSGSLHSTTQNQVRQNTYTLPNRPKKLFNSPKADYLWGISVGYVQKKLDGILYDYNYNRINYDPLLEGFQAGIRFEPLFKYGFGLNTGLFYEYYAYYIDYKEHVVNVPVHLEYRFNISQYFNIFILGGMSGNVMTNTYSDDYFFNATFDYGAGIRIDHFQINIEQKVKSNDYKSLVVSCSYMF